MNMLDQLRLKAKKKQAKISKEQPKPKESNTRPLPRILDFFLERRAMRISSLCLILNRQPDSIELEQSFPSPKGGLSYIG